MVQPARPLVILAALAAGLFVVADGQPQQRVAHVSPPVTTKAPTPVPVAKPKTTRSIEHRKVIRPAPKMMKREAAPVQRPKAVKQQKRERVTVKKQRVATRGLPSCSYVKREYDRMNASQRWAAYLAASSEQVEHGKRCLGM